MANAFYGRLAAYERRQDADDAGGGAGAQSLARRGPVDAGAQALAAYALPRASILQPRLPERLWISGRLPTI